MRIRRLCPQISLEFLQKKDYPAYVELDEIAENLETDLPTVVNEINSLGIHINLGLLEKRKTRMLTSGDYLQVSKIKNREGLIATGLIAYRGFKDDGDTEFYVPYGARTKRWIPRHILPKREIAKLA